MPPDNRGCAARRAVLTLTSGAARAGTRASRTGCGLPVGRTEERPKVGEGVPDEDALDL